MTMRRTLSLSVTTLLKLALCFQGFGCKPHVGQDSESLSVTKSVPWEELKEGQPFRMSPPGQASSCYLPGGNGLTLGNCGDRQYWIVTKAHNPYIKQIKSQIDNKCLEFDGGKLTSNNCSEDSTPKRESSWGDEDLSPLQKQYLNVLGDRLVPAFRRDCSSVTGSRMRTGGKCKVVADSSKPAGHSEPVEFLVGDESTEAHDKLIYRSETKQAKKEDHTGSFASEIRWGHLPRIRAISIATQGEPFANVANSWITGIQIHYASGERFLIGNCKQDTKGMCIVDNSDHPNYPNPIQLAPDEYLTAVGMKFGQGSMRADRRNLKHGHDTRLVELIFKTNKSGSKMILWKGRGDQEAPWQWLLAHPGMMIAGFFGSHAALEWNGQGISTLIHSMGVIYATLDAYKAHNPDVFAKASPGEPSIQALASKDGSAMLGLSSQNAEFHASLIDYNVRTGRPGPAGIASQAAFDQIFDDPGAKFSSTFYAGSMGNSVRTSSVRAYFKEGILVAIVVHPEGVSDVVKPEVYGEIPEKTQPSLILELAADEHITEVNWKTGIEDAGTIDKNARAAGFSGPTISGLQFKTNKGKEAQFAESAVRNQSWKKGLGRSGYAIVGFHGVFTTEPFRTPLNTLGILNLGAWIVKTSELP